MARPLISLRLVLNALPRHPSRSTSSLGRGISTHKISLYPSYSFTRSYATHKSATDASSSSHGNSDATADLLRNAGAARKATEGQDSVGPFPLGVGASGRRKTWRSWKELGVGGKLVRTTQQTGNLAVILVGGTLFVILTLSLTTELFAKNSPSVLYFKAVDMIRDSDALNPHLLPPLKFTHSPHSSAPVRGSAPIPHTFVKHPTSGRDHMLLTFWVHGRGKDEPEQLGWLKSTYRQVEGYGRQGLIYVGLIQPHPENEGEGLMESTNSGTVQSFGREEEQPGMLNRWFGGFTSSLRTQSSGSGAGRRKDNTRGLPPPGTYTIGECRAEYVKNASGQFTLLSLSVDIPSSKVSYPSRAVIYTSPEASTEGLLGKRIR
ncbi:uncharacterized protein I303_102872 [Kwoniella dejecticola CBS 10117]|uniref:Mitochondrial import inner membrane translocase subunit Tim21 n=1 Tax=Kwoniella dejecticola CBS 10117 TaxID=1296121 RepID=A0A1A6A9Z1_9TREE|nr:uncharacterized protein I303_02891 [Kwoniella dejecticola CBS 10117]OBR86871.1 hypothetical protein I303_02891 [Kwoniella dejecticola CBS 10117]